MRETTARVYKNPNIQINFYARILIHNFLFIYFGLTRRSYENILISV